jgi:hypothetical protein
MALEKDGLSGNYNSPAHIDTVLDTKNNDGGNNPNFDTERGTKYPPAYGQARKNGRIAPVLPHLRAYDFSSDESGEDVLGKQIEMEADNAIQYRTCSWQKVCFFLAQYFIWEYPVQRDIEVNDIFLSLLCPSLVMWPIERSHGFGLSRAPI